MRPSACSTGTLAMPDAAHAPARGFPAVVLVHGSGATDRDETIGPNRPLLDIARGLADTVAMLESKSRSKSVQVRIETA